MLCNYFYHLYAFFAVLQAPTFAQAVWIIGSDAFHVCWSYPASALQDGSSYRIMNTQYDELISVNHDMNNSSYSIDITGECNGVDNFILIQVLPSTQMETFPSKPVRVNVSG